jgi:hypothetical protein
MIAQFSPLAHALESDGSMAVRLPRGTPMRNAVVSAAGNLTVGDRAQIAGPTATVGLLANADTGRTQIGVSALIGGNVISTPQVFLSNYARLAASLYTTTAPSKQAGATIVGTVKTDAALSPSTLVRWTPPAAATGPDFIVYPDHIGTLTAGAYKKVAIYSRSEVTLSAGTYQMESFDIEPQATVEFDNRLGPIVIYVSSELLLKGTATVLGAAGDFAIVYTGGNAVNVETPFSGAIVAPYAALRLAAMGSKRFVGQFFGKSVAIDPDVKVTYSKFNWDSIQPLLGAGPATALTKTDPLPQQTFATCYSPSFAGTLGTGAGGSRYYTSLTYVAPNPATGVCAPVFVDKRGNPITSPTQAQLNTKPPATSTCAAVPANVDHCPIDADTLTTICSTDADCTAGQLCSAFCTDIGCTSIEYRCGSPSATCGGLPQEGSCEDYLLEPLPGAVGTPNPTQLDSQFAPTTSLSPSALVDPSDQDVPPTTFATVESQMCSAPRDIEEKVEDGSDKPGNDGNTQWGVYLKPITSFKVKPVKRNDKISKFSLLAEGGFEAGGIVFGTKVEVLKAALSASLDDCGIKLIGAVKLFGEAVATWTPGAADKYHLATNSKNDSLETPKLDSDACKDARARTQAAMFSTRNTNVQARAVKQYYATNGLTPELCHEIEDDLGPIKDNFGNPYDCDNPAGMDPIGQVNFIDAWKKEYKAYVKKYTEFSKEIGVAQQKIHAEGTIEIFKKEHPYNRQVLNQYFPIGPVTLNLAVEGFGRWSVGGGIQFGVSRSGTYNALLNDLVKGELPELGDIRAYAGPVFTPALGVGVLAFVGVGIPGVAVGIQGDITLLDLSLPSGIVVAAMRVSKPDPRSVVGTEFEGEPIPDMESKQYKWVYGLSWDSKLDLTFLKGQLDLALRIQFLAFKKTFKKTLFSWPGFHKSFTLISGGTGDALKSGDHFGKQADNIAYTDIPDVTGPIITNPSGPPAPYACGGG